MTTVAAQRPSMEQIERIRALSAVALHDPGSAFARWGYPSTREEASALIRRLDGMRTHDDPADIEIPEEEKPMGPAVPDSKTCSKCRDTKPLDEFHRNKATRDGFTGWCKECTAAQHKAKRKGGTDVTRRPRLKAPATTDAVPATELVGHFALASGDHLPEPDPPLSPNGDWRSVLADPTLSRLKAIQGALGIPTLDETAQVCQLITEGVTQ